MEMRGFDFVSEDTLTAVFLSMILSTGGEYWVDNKFKFTTPQAEEALQLLVNYVTVDQLTNLDSATFLHEMEIGGAYFIGRNEALMVPSGPWAVPYLQEEYDQVYGVDFDFAKFPFYGTTPAFPVETGWSMCVPEDSGAANAAWAYVKFFLEKENLMRHNINCGQISPRKSVVSDLEYVRQLPYMEPILDILEYGRFIGPFNADVLKSSFRSVFVALCSIDDSTHTSVTESLAYLETRLNSDLGL